MSIHAKRATCTLMAIIATLVLAMVCCLGTAPAALATTPPQANAAAQEDAASQASAPGQIDLTAQTSVSAQTNLAVQAKSTPSINLKSASLQVGKKTKLKVTGGTGKTTWKSSNKAVATVTKAGKVTAKKAGSATITAIKGGKKLACAITVAKRSSKSLVVFFSHSGTTLKAAKKVQAATGGDLLRIYPKKAYTTDYDKLTELAQNEYRTQAKPASATKALNMKQYSTVFVGFPVWWDNMPRLVQTFLGSCNLKGKTVVAFCTSGGSGIEGSMKAVRSTCKGANVIVGRDLTDDSAAHVKKWISELETGSGTGSGDASDSSVTGGDVSNGNASANDDGAATDSDKATDSGNASSGSNNAADDGSTNNADASGDDSTNDSGGGDTPSKPESGTGESGAGTPEGGASDSGAGAPESGTGESGAGTPEGGASDSGAGTSDGTGADDQGAGKPAGTEPSSGEGQGGASTVGEKMLVACFSATGTTWGHAQYIADKLGAELYRIEPEQPYTSADLNYSSDCRANREQNDPTARPAIAGGAIDLARYDTVFVGFPIWWGTCPKIIDTFIESNDLEGKTIIPFCTSGSSGIGAAQSHIASVLTSSDVKNGRRIGSQSEIEPWLQSLE